MDLLFYINSILLGAGLAADAFSVSLANGLNEPHMKKSKTLGIAGVFGIFQTVMPMIGWFLVTKLIEAFKTFEKFIPYIALILLLYIGGKMLIEGIKNEESDQKAALSFTDLLIQGIATSIDALSVGFTIANYGFGEALIETIIIGVTTFIICVCGLQIGKKFGTKLANKAGILGGVILIAIGIEIFIKGVF